MRPARNFQASKNTNPVKVMPRRPLTARTTRMKTITILLSMVLGGIALPAAAEFQAGQLSVRNFSWDGLNRSYTVYAPIGYDGSKRPLVIDIHGYTGNGSQQAGFSGFKSLADSEGFLVAWPEGSSNAWNAGICCGTPQSQGVDDVGFIREVVARISDEALVDPTAIYATGLSNGGAMSHRLACEAADLFAAAAPIAFPVPFFPLSQCQPSRPIAVTMVMGLTDNVVSYDPPFGFLPGALNSFEHWADVNVCEGNSPDLVEPLPGEASCETYTTCGEGVETQLCSIVGTPGSGLDGHILYYNQSGYDVAADAAPASCMLLLFQAVLAILRR